MRVERLGWLASALIGLAVGCTYTTGEDTGSTADAIVRPDAYVTPVDDWETVQGPQRRVGQYLYDGHYYQGTICFPFSDVAARCGDDNTVTLGEGETETHGISGTFSPPHSPISFTISSSTSYTTTTSVVIRGQDCDYCWAYVCYAMKIEPRRRRNRTRYQRVAPRVTYSSPAIDRFCKDADLECGCIDAGPDANVDASDDAGFETVVDAGPGDAGEGDAGSGEDAGDAGEDAGG